MTLSRTATESLTAAAIIARLLVVLPKRFPCRAWRRNVGAARTEHGLIRFGVPGEPDIDGILTINGCGIRLGIEVKAARDKLSEQQIRFGQMLTRHGGIYLVARDVEQALSDLAFKIQTHPANHGPQS